MLQNTKTIFFACEGLNKLICYSYPPRSLFILKIAAMFIGNPIRSLKYKREIQPWEDVYFEVLRKYLLFQVNWIEEKTKCDCMGCRDFLHTYKTELRHIDLIENLILPMVCPLGNY